MIDDLLYLLRASLSTLALSLISISVSTVLGVLIGVACAFRVPIIPVFNTICVGFVRGVPLLVVIFAIYYSAPAFGFDIDPFAAAVVGLSFYFTFFASEIIRGAIAGVPRGQFDAANSIGLSFWQRARLVILPQALRSALPPMINTWLILVKGSAFASVIGVWELTTASTELAQRTVAPFQVYGASMMIYFAICFALARCGSFAEKRLRFQT